MADAVGFASGKQACLSCNIILPIENKYFRYCTEIRNGKPYSFRKRVCRKCEHEKRGVHRQANLDRTNAIRRTNATYAKTRHGNLKKNYGISLAEYEVMLKAQNYQCAICEKESTEIHRSGRPITLVVDHDHSTGKIRGLLCGPCNRGLGDFRETQSTMVKAIRYLRLHKHG